MQSAVPPKGATLRPVRLCFHLSGYGRAQTGAACISSYGVSLHAMLFISGLLESMMTILYPGRYSL